MLLGLIAAAILVRDSLVRGLVSVLLGLLLGLVGTDVYSGSPRFTFGFLKLSDGIGLVPIALVFSGLRSSWPMRDAMSSMAAPISSAGDR